MGLFRIVFSVMILVAAAFFSVEAMAQDMDTAEGVYRQQYEQYTSQESALQDQIDNFTNLKSQVDGLLAQISSTPSANYAQEAERYRQIQLLLPSAIQYSQQLDQRQRQLTEVQRRKSELRGAILARQSALPIWWTH
jgi:hypothetical protein